MGHLTIVRSCIIITLLAACQKNDEDAPSDPVNIPDSPADISTFSQLDSGNYWVYDRYRVDSLDVADPVYYVRDSLHVVGDTVLAGNTYAVIHHAVNGVFTTNIHYWRDSADCIVERYGAVLFCSGNFDQTIYIDSIPAPNNLSIHYSVPSGTVPISVPAGDFDAYLMLGTCFSYGSFPFIPEWKYPRTYWAEGVGRVKWYGYFASGDLGFRYELADYHLE